MRRFLAIFAAVANLLLADAVVKEIASGLWKNAAPCEVIPGFFNLAYVENRGCAWGMLQGHVWPLAVFGMVALVFLLWKRKEIFPLGKFGFIAEVLIYAGIVGNLIDRVWRGYVIDMFDFYLGSSHFPCFTLADSYICISASILILCSFVKRTS